jgi:hypothetical protein
MSFRRQHVRVELSVVERGLSETSSLTTSAMLARAMTAPFPWGAGGASADEAGKTPTTDYGRLLCRRVSLVVFSLDKCASQRGTVRDAPSELPLVHLHMCLARSWPCRVLRRYREGIKGRGNRSAWRLTCRKHCRSVSHINTPEQMSAASDSVDPDEVVNATRVYHSTISPGHIVYPTLGITLADAKVTPLTPQAST